MSSKEFYFPSVEVVTLDGSMHVPTIVYYYSEDEFLIGHQALEAKKSTRDLHVNFKVDLGEYKSDVKYPEQIPTATGRWKTTFEITEDFIGEVIDYLDLTIRDIERIRTCILVAEPIAMQSGLVSDKWLSNYRANVKESLKAKGFENVQFLPEPFAVFQHYRYNTKHPLLARSEKQYVLVVDFGGGTFDTSIIETTKEGDIRKGGRHSKPLAACSVPYGGYFINECIAIG